MLEITYFFIKIIRIFLTHFIHYKYKCLYSNFFTANIKHGLNKNIKTIKYKFIELKANSKAVSKRFFKPSPWWRRCHAVTDEGIDFYTKF